MNIDERIRRDCDIVYKSRLCVDAIKFCFVIVILIVAGFILKG